MWSAARVSTIRGGIAISIRRAGVAVVARSPAQPAVFAPSSSITGGSRASSHGSSGSRLSFAATPAVPSSPICFGGVGRMRTNNSNSNISSNNNCATLGNRRGVARAAEGGGGGGGSGAGKGGSGGGGGGGGEGAGGGGGGKEGGRGGGGGGIWGLYLRALETNPLGTKCFTSGVLNAAGDLFAQFMFEGAAENGCDLRRTGVFTFLGAVLVGPALHAWYSSLSKIVTATGATGTAAAAVSLALDQLVFAPTFLAVFIASLFTIEGNAAEVPAKLKQDWSTTVVTNWKIWVPFQFLNFRFVPVNLQVGAANVIALLWNTYMSWVTHLKVADK